MELPDAPPLLEMGEPRIVELESGEIQHYCKDCHEVEMSLTLRYDLAAEATDAVPLPEFACIEDIWGVSCAERLLDPSGFDVGGAFGRGSNISFREASVVAPTTGIHFGTKRCLRNWADRSLWVVARFPEPVIGIVSRTINHLRENPYYEGEAGTDAWFYRFPHIDGGIWESDAVVDLARDQLNTIWPEELNQIGLNPDE